MGSSPHIHCERTGAHRQVLIVRINRAEFANAYTTDMLRALDESLDDARRDDSVRAAILTGTGDNFCAGADLDEVRKRGAHDALSLLSRDVFDRWAQAPWPTVAALNGPAVGGGFELALAADLRVCAPHAFLHLPEPELGLIPAAGGIRRLVASLGPMRATELILFGKRLDSASALSWGLVSQVHDDPVELALALLEPVTRRDKLCLSVAKLLLRDRADMSRGVAGEAIAQALLYSSQQDASAR